MKIVITGCGHGLGKNICNNLSNDFDVVCLSDKVEKYVDRINEIVMDSDVFINCGYKDKIQTQFFEIVFNQWKYEKKTIINILTSALIFGGPNEKYITNKKDLENKTFQLRTTDKEVRVVNVYPNTLENTDAPNQKLKFDEVSDIVKWIIGLPHHIEIFQIGISKTKLKLDNSLL